MVVVGSDSVPNVAQNFNLDLLFLDMVMCDNSDYGKDVYNCECVCSSVSIAKKIVVHNVNITDDLPHGRPPPELPPRSPTSSEATPSLPPNQPDLLRQISAQGAPQSTNEGRILYHIILYINHSVVQ